MTTHPHKMTREEKFKVAAGYVINLGRCVMNANTLQYHLNQYHYGLGESTVMTEVLFHLRDNYNLASIGPGLTVTLSGLADNYHI